MQDIPIIPQDLESCQRLLQEALAVQAELTETCESLSNRRLKLEQENEELQLTIKLLLQRLYGRRTERFVEAPGQLHLNFGDEESPELDPSILSAVPDDEEFEEIMVRRRKARKRRSEQLPDHLERRTERIEPELPAGVQLEDCAPLGVDIVEILEFQRGKLWVRRLEYPKYKLPSAVSPSAVEAETTSDAEGMLAAEAVTNAELVPGTEAAEKIDTLVSVASRSHAEATNNGEPPTDTVDDAQLSEDAQPLPTVTPDVETASTVVTEPAAVPAPPVVKAHGIVQAPREVTLIEGGRFGFSVAAEILFNKFGMHLPLYRQQDSMAQMGWSPTRSTLGQIVATSADLLAPLAMLFRHRVLASEIIGTDDTPVRLLTPREGDGSRQARFWLYRGRDAAPYDVFAFTDNRTRAGPDQFLEPFRGILSGDCYSGYVNIEQVTGGRIKFSACLAHGRRYVFNAREQQPVLASQMLAVIRQLYDIEDRGRTMDDAGRLEVRQVESVPLMTRLRELLDSEAATRVLPKSKFGEALHYLRNNWDAFQVYLHDGRVPIDNTDVERDLRRIAIGRNNWLFLGSPMAGERTAIIFTIVASGHRHDLDVWAYIRDVLEKLAYGRAAAGGDVWATDEAVLQGLLPDVWAKSHPESIRTFRVDEKQRRAETRRFKRAQRRRVSASG